MIRIVIALLVVGAGLMRAQAPARPSFEVASVKPAPNCTMRPNAGPSAGRLDLPCVTLKTMITAAYGGFTGEKLNARFLEVIGGAAWIDSDRFDISAKADSKVSAAVLMGPMLQSLLEERFQLKLHIEPREKPVYVLTLAKDASKLTPWKEGGCVPLDLNNLPKPGSGVEMPRICGGPMMKMTNGKFTADIPGVTMEELAGRMLAQYAGRPVVDKTGLTGRYDLKLEFSPEMPGGMRLNGEPAPPGMMDNAGPTIFVALQQQLGLKLTPDKAPIDVIVVDSAQKPTEN
jgi:uncharacterized protein (TIGR03435 family)